jgi:hypothetical protein
MGSHMYDGDKGPAGIEKDDDAEGLTSSMLH